MSSKIISLTVAGLIGLQSAAMAQDRTAGIGDEQIRIAKENVRALKAEIQSLDKALGDAQVAIEKRESRGTFANGTAVTGAAIGLGLSAIAALTIKKGTGGQALNGYLTGALSAVISLSSAGLGLIGQARKTDVDTKSLEEQLKLAETQVQSAISVADKQTSAVLKQLNSSLTTVRQSLNEYTISEDSISQNKLFSQIAQASGVAITVYGMTQRESKALLVGPLVMSAGNLGQVLGGLSDSDAEKVIAEIKATRLSLMAAAVNLE
ncbi:hypothetical protein [Bdellovibrio sp. ArHS]|uniref:hypothetical protein n=1 Tax=Bdellovibrio sp. ArHS TaxID=1569284 RepID=UPI000ACD7899|nr:hypothetical protein [Bdellovibrio sp. ArHS]